MTKQEILEKAERIIAEKEKNDIEYVRTCVRADICPKCGEEIELYELNQSLGEIVYACGSCNSVILVNV